MIANAVPSSKQKVIWKPIPGIVGPDGKERLSSQGLALAAPVDILFLDGPRGPGKTAAQYMDFRKIVGRGYGKFWRGIIFDREHDNLGDLVAQTKREFPKFDDGCKFKESKGDYKWVWPTGEELLFRHVKKPEDYNGFHGHEYPWIGWNEITKYPTRFLYDKFMSVNRCSFDPESHTPKIERNGKLVYNTPDGKPLPPIPLKIFITTNPNGPGHNWVKEEFVDSAPPGKITTAVTELENTLTGEVSKVEKKQVRIFGNFFENPFIPDEYRIKIIDACARDKNLKAAWIDGDWDINAGGALDDKWNNDVHIINRFSIPPEWHLDRSHDWGSTQPFATVWWAEANGEEVTLLDGSTWCPVRGSLIAICEDYGTEGRNTNKGVKKSAKNVAIDILEIEKSLMTNRWIASRPEPGPADNSIFNTNDTGTDNIGTLMELEGVYWTRCDKTKGSRKNGLQAIRDRLENSITGEGPGLYFMRNCVYCIHTIPPIPRDEKDPDDVDTDAEDHCYDAVRYRVLDSMNRIVKKIETTWNQ